MHNLDWSDDATWRTRFRTERILWAQVATQNSDRGIACVEREGVAQLYAWQTSDGTLRQLTQAEAGVEQGYIAADGSAVYIHDAQDNAGLGHHQRVPFAAGDPIDISADMPPYASFYLTEAHSGVSVGYSAAAPEWGFRVYVQDPAGKILFTYESEDFCVGPNLSHDGTIAVIASADPNNNWEFTLEAYDVPTGQKLGNLSAAGGVQPIGFVPRAGDERYLATQTIDERVRPIIWDPRANTRHLLTLDDLAGDVDAWDWSEDGRYLLLRQRHTAQHQLHIYDMETEAAIKLNHPTGTYSAATFVNDAIYATMQSAGQPLSVIELDKTTGQERAVLLTGNNLLPESHTWQRVSFASQDDTRVQGWLLQPAGDGPFPALVHAHGGPDDVVTERFDPALQAWVDSGFAVLSVNYRGSTTFGSDFEQAIISQPGKLESDDLAAAAHWLVAEGIAQTPQIFLTGASYGGYLTLLTLSLHPERFACGMAIVPITDWNANYATTDATLQRRQEQLFGGDPTTKQQAMRDASPITHAEALSAPLLILQAENDSRYPAQQVRDYVERLNALEKSVALHWYDAQATALRADEHVALMMRFVADRLDTQST